MAVIGEVILMFHDDGTVTSAGFSAGEASEHAAAVRTVTDAIPGSTVVDDPWNTQGTQVATPAAHAAPSCVHGPLKAVPAGFSQRANKAYPAFWACQAPQGVAKCRLDKSQLPPVPA